MKTSKTTTLAPATVFDTQVLAICKQLDRDLEPDPVDVIRRALHAVLDGLTLEAALGILRTLGYHKDIVYRDNEKWSVTDLGLSSFFPEYQGRLAREIKGIWFWGGPPNKLTWYQGSLETLVKDRVYYELDNHGVENVAGRLGI